MGTSASHLTHSELSLSPKDSSSLMVVDNSPFVIALLAQLKPIQKVLDFISSVASSLEANPPS